MNPTDWGSLLPALPANTRIALHAPTAQALARARGNFKNLTAAQPQAEVWIIANAQAVQAVVDAPQEMGPALSRVLLCPNTLKNNGLIAPEGAQVLPVGAVQALVRMQIDGWVYIRS